MAGCTASASRPSLSKECRDAVSLQSALGPGRAIQFSKPPCPVTLCLGTPHSSASVQVGWSQAKQFWSDFSSDGALSDVVASAAGAALTGASISAGDRLGSGETRTFWFFVTWHEAGSGPFKDAADVAAHVAANCGRIAAGTQRFRDTFYDSTVPRWLLDCVSANLPCLQDTSWLRALALLKTGPSLDAKRKEWTQQAYARAFGQAGAQPDTSVPAAARLVAHDRVQEGLTLAALTHERHEAVVRNPWDQSDIGPSFLRRTLGAPSINAEASACRRT